MLNAEVSSSSRTGQDNRLGEGYNAHCSLVSFISRLASTDPSDYFPQARAQSRRGCRDFRSSSRQLPHLCLALSSCAGVAGD